MPTIFNRRLASAANFGVTRLRALWFRGAGGSAASPQCGGVGRTAWCRWIAMQEFSGSNPLPFAPEFRTHFPGGADFPLVTCALGERNSFHGHVLFEYFRNQRTGCPTTWFRELQSSCQKPQDRQKWTFGWCNRWPDFQRQDVLLLSSLYRGVCDCAQPMTPRNHRFPGYRIAAEPLLCGYAAVFKRIFPISERLPELGAGFAAVQRQLFETRPHTERLQHPDRPSPKGPKGQLCFWPLLITRRSSHRPTEGPSLRAAVRFLSHHRISLPFFSFTNSHSWPDRDHQQRKSANDPAGELQQRIG